MTEWYRNPGRSGFYVKTFRYKGYETGDTDGRFFRVRSKDPGTGDFCILEADDLPTRGAAKERIDAQGGS